MSGPAVAYAEQSASREAIHSHLVKCDGNHRPPLSTRVDLAEYAAKIFGGASTFEAWAGGELVGLVATYLNDAGGGSGYITNVSVTRAFMGRGIASALMAMCMKKASERGIRDLSLEVSKGNAEAIELYRKFGFAESLDKGESIMMKLSA